MNRIIKRLDFSPTHFSKLFRPVPHFVRIQNGTVYECYRNAVRTKPESVYESLRNCQSEKATLMLLHYNGHPKKS